MGIWYFTFGLAHPFHNRVQPIEGEYDKAREVMFRIYGSNWCDQLAIYDAMRQINKYHYKMLPLVCTDE